MKTVLGLVAMFGLTMAMNTAQAGKVYVSGGVSVSSGSLSIGIHSGPGYHRHGYHRYYPGYRYYPRYYRAHPRYYEQYYRHNNKNWHRHHKREHQRHYRSW